MKAVLCIAALVAATSGHPSGGVVGVGHVGVATVAHPVAVATAHPVVGHGVGIGHGVGLGHGVAVGHGVGVVGHGGAPGTGLNIYPDEISPYTYQYNVADDYSGSNFQ